MRLAPSLTLLLAGASITFALTMITAGCSRSSNVSISTPTPSPSSSPEDLPHKIANAETVAQEDDFDPNYRAGARTSAIEFAKRQNPGWQVEGASAVAYTGNLYLVTVDLSLAKQQKMVNVIAHLFLTKDAEYYWKCEPLSADLGRALSALAMEHLKSRNRSLEKSTEGGPSQ